MKKIHFRTLLTADSLLLPVACPERAEGSSCKPDSELARLSTCGAQEAPKLLTRKLLSRFSMYTVSRTVLTSTFEP